MNATSPIEPARWTARRWLYAIATVFLAQVALIFFLAEKPPRLLRAPQFRTAINLALEPQSEEQLAQLPALDDPTLFALPNLEGFSGAAWLTFAPLEHHFSDWTNSTHWLELDPAGLGKTFLAAVNANRTAPLLIANSPLPSLSTPRPSLTNETLIARSEVTIEGDLARRPLLNPILLPPWPHSNILANTIIQLLVDADGDVLPPTLLVPSGHAAADQFALRQAASARFQPLGGIGQSATASPQVTWGKAIFKWHTIPPSLTNTFSGP